MNTTDIAAIATLVCHYNKEDTPHGRTIAESVADYVAASDRRQQEDNYLQKHGTKMFFRFDPTHFNRAAFLAACYGN